MTHPLSSVADLIREHCDLLAQSWEPSGTEDEQFLDLSAIRAAISAGDQSALVRLASARLEDDAAKTTAGRWAATQALSRLQQGCAPELAAHHAVSDTLGYPEDREQWQADWSQPRMVATLQQDGRKTEARRLAAQCGDSTNPVVRKAASAILAALQ